MSRTLDPPAATAMQRLISRLEELRLRPCDSIEALLKFDGGPEKLTSPTAAYVVNSQIRVLDHHDVAPTVLVYDPYLGTIGLVEVVAANDVAVYRSELERLIERAAYLRQLTVLEAERRGKQRRALTVELVIVFPKDAAAVAGESISTILREIARDTGYLEAIGVGLLNEQSTGGFVAADVRRAFAWVLDAARRWYADQKRKSAGAAQNWELVLENYRHSRHRTFAFDGTAKFHVVHGYNGTGKSSFTEALELLLTGEIERLKAAGQSAYFPVIRYKSGQPALGNGDPAADETDASASLHVANRSLVSVSITKSPAESAASDHDPVWAEARTTPALTAAASFRLDQPTMDMLVRNNDADRASLFLRAFFPAERPLFEQLDAARRSTQALVETLPAPLRESTDGTDARAALRERLFWTTKPVGKWESDTVTTILTTCLPISPAQLELLAHASPSIADAYNAAKRPMSALDVFESTVKGVDAVLDALEAALKGVDAALEKLSPDPATMKRHLEVAIGVFREFNAWTAGGQAPRGGSVKAAVDAWLELRALADLAGKQCDIAATLAAAQHGGWRPSENAPRFAQVPTDAQMVDTLRRTRDDLVRARDEARTVVRRWSAPPPSAGAGAASGSGDPPRPTLTPKEVESLNLVGNWLPCASPEGAPLALGDLFRSVLGDRTSRGVGAVTIGAPGGFDTAIREAGELLQAAETLAAPHGSAAATFRRCRDAAAALEKLATQEAEIEQTFLSKIARSGPEGHLLNEAVNELLALFKPAPWANPDISLCAEQRGSGRDREELGLRMADNSKADLRLNTAELNSLTLALFLLCAPGLDNPLRTLVLDDPMQNMDEMTVSAIARGLAKIVAILPAEWQIVALFHGEDDVRRVRDEVACAVYRLPWLAPTTVAEKKAIGFEDDSTWKVPLQTLAELQHSIA